MLRAGVLVALMSVLATVSTPASETNRSSGVAAPSTIPVPDIIDQRRPSAREPTSAVSTAISIESPIDGSTVRGAVELRLDTDLAEPDQARLEVRVDKAIVYHGDYRNPLALPPLERGRHEIEVRIDAAAGATHESAEAHVRIFVQQSSRLLPSR